MLKKNADRLSEIQLEIMNTLMGYEDTKKLHNKKQATRRLFKARRAIEEHREIRKLATVLDRKAWFDSL